MTYQRGSSRWENLQTSWRGLKFSKTSKTTLRLSVDSLSIALLSTLFTLTPQQADICSKEPALISWDIYSEYSRTSSYITALIYLLSKWSKTPSLPSKIKSVSSDNYKTFISGTATMQLGFPPYRSILAMQSPKALETCKIVLTRQTYWKTSW